MTLAFGFDGGIDMTDFTLWVPRGYRQYQWVPPWVPNEPDSASPSRFSHDVSAESTRLGVSRAVCHGEGRGFESLHPLRRSLRIFGGFVVSGALRDVLTWEGARRGSLL